MKAALYFALTAAAIIATGCSSGESYVKQSFDFSQVEKVAVIDVDSDLPGKAAKDQIASFFEMQLLKKGYSPIERSQIEALLEEQDFQASDLTSAENAARAGRILNVPTVVVVSVPQFGEEISMTAKMIDTEDGSILWMGDGSGTTGKTLGTILGAAGGALVGVAVTGHDDRVLGGIGGGVIGGAGAMLLSPQEAKVAKDIIKKMCDTLPQRYAMGK